MVTESPRETGRRKAVSWIRDNRVVRSIFRRGYPDNDLDRAAVMFSNFFLHVLPARTHVHSLKPTTPGGSASSPCSSS